MTCTSDANEICGGEYANSIYRVDLSCFNETTSSFSSEQTSINTTTAALASTEKISMKQNQFI